MLTAEDKKLILDLLNKVEVRGNRQQIKQTLERLDKVAAKVEALPEEPVKAAEKSKNTKK